MGDMTTYLRWRHVQAPAGQDEGKKILHTSRWEVELGQVSSLINKFTAEQWVPLEKLVILQ